MQAGKRENIKSGYILNQGFGPFIINLQSEQFGGREIQEYHLLVALILFNDRLFKIALELAEAYIFEITDIGLRAAKLQLLLPYFLDNIFRHGLIGKAGENVIVAPAVVEPDNIFVMNGNIRTVVFALHDFKKVIVNFNNIQMVFRTDMPGNFLRQRTGAGTNFQYIQGRAALA